MAEMQVGVLDAPICDCIATDLWVPRSALLLLTGWHVLLCNQAGLEYHAGA